MSTLDDCFRELVRDILSDFLKEHIKDISDTDIDGFVEDPYSFNEYIADLFNVVVWTDLNVTCLNIINNDASLFQEMIEYIRHEEHDEDYVYDGLVLGMFNTFTHFWGIHAIMDEDGIFVDMIREALETEATERDRQREIKRIMPLVINRLTIPNELTKSIMLIVGERC